MKKTMMVTGLAMLVTVATLHAQSTGDIPDDLLNKNLKDWQLNGVTLLLIVTTLGRIYSALKGGGGLIGVWRGIVYGTNTPPPPPTV